MTQLTGMTGFGRASGEADWGRWSWEARSVNGRGLDVRINTPPGFDGLDRVARQAISQRFKRGSLQISLRLDLNANDNQIAINEKILDALCARFEERHGAPPGETALAMLMGVKGVVEMQAASIRDLAVDEAARTLLTEGLSDALDELSAARQAEGKALVSVLAGLLDQMEGERHACEKGAKNQPGALRQKLHQRLEDLITGAEIDRERLALEAAIHAAKADVREELDRLAAHLETGRAHLAGGSPIGRKLDFLAQELNREVNTLCSKSASLELTQSGLALKGLVDQFKEQAANVE